MFKATVVRMLHLGSYHLKNHYLTLGVSQRATQAEIKSAYYKLSLLFHPDKNHGSKEAEAKFQSINAAYEVLGDYKKRRLYDRGLLVQDDDHSSGEELRSEPNIVQKQRPVTTGRSPIYNYDEWSKAHYGQAFQRRNEAKERYERNKKFQEEADNYNKSRTVGAVFVGFFFLGYFYNYLFSNSLDKPLPPKVKKNVENSPKTY